MTEKTNMVLILKEMHADLIGDTNGFEETLTDAEKIIGILHEFQKMLEELKDHSHTIS